MSPKRYPRFRFLCGGDKILYAAQVASVRVTCFSHYLILNLTMVKIGLQGSNHITHYYAVLSDAVLLVMFSTTPCS